MFFVIITIKLELCIEENSGNAVAVLSLPILKYLASRDYSLLSATCILQFYCNLTLTETIL